MLTAAVKTLSNATEEAVAQIAQGTIDILLKHLHSTKLNLTYKFFKKTVFFLSKQKKFFFNITFSCCSLTFLVCTFHYINIS